MLGERQAQVPSRQDIENQQNPKAGTLGDLGQSVIRPCCLAVFGEQTTVSRGDVGLTNSTQHAAPAGRAGTTSAARTCSRLLGRFAGKTIRCHSRSAGSYLVR